MPNNCIIVGCTNREGRNGVKMYRIPSIRQSKGEEVKALTVKRQRLWLEAIKRLDFVDEEKGLKSSYRVCSEHFVKGRPASFFEEHNPDWVPSLKLGHETDLNGHYVRRRGRKRKVKNEHKETALNAATALVDMSVGTSYDMAAGTSFNTDQDFGDELGPFVKDMSVQTDVSGYQLDAERKALEDTRRDLVDLREKLKNMAFDESKFKDDDEKTKFYTGLPSWNHLLYLLNFLAPAMHHKKNSLSKFQEILLVLMKLRLGLINRFLGDIFSIDQTTVSRIFNRVLNVMYNNMKFLIYWPKRDDFIKTMPMEFVKCFGGRVTIIIDCFEIIIDHPCNFKAKSDPFPNNKTSDTIKYLIGVTPQGVVSYISQGWGGTTSDKHIVEHPEFLAHLEQGDLVITDRCFNGQDNVGLMCAELQMPAFTSGEKQLSSWEIDATRKVAHLRNHVWRALGCIRNRYTILGTKVPFDYVIAKDEGYNTLDQIITVCASLANLNPSVIPFS